MQNRSSPAYFTDKQIVLIPWPSLLQGGGKGTIWVSEQAENKIECKGVSATGKVWWVPHTKVPCPQDAFQPWIQCVAGHTGLCLPGNLTHLKTNYPNLWSPAPPGGQTNALESSSSRGQNWYHVIQRPLHKSHLFCLSSGQRPEEMRTLLSARIF